jgi:type IV pilus assembly protein PilP
MKDKKIIIFAVILLTLVGYYVWYSQKTATPEPQGKAMVAPRSDPRRAVIKKVHRAVGAYKKDTGNVPRNLAQLKGKYLDAKTLKDADAINLNYKYVHATSYQITTSGASSAVKLAAKKAASTGKPGAAGTSPTDSAASTLGQLLTTETGWKYDPTGKPDPFKSFILAAAAQEETGPKVVRRQLTPLQKMPLSEIEAGLKAIIWGQLGSKALVEDATGKGYVVQEGTYVGQHDGIVKKIYEDRIIVEEYRRDPGKDRLEPNEVVLKLKKVGAEE